MVRSSYCQQVMTFFCLQFTARLKLQFQSGTPLFKNLDPPLNPAVQQVSFLSELLQLFCKGDVVGKEIASVCSKYLFKNDDKNLVFLFDGFDEYPEMLQINGLISNILKHQVLFHLIYLPQWNSDKKHLSR